MSLGSGRTAGGRGVLHPVGLPDYRPVAQPLAAVRISGPGKVLAAARPSPAPRPIRDAGRGQPVGGGLRHLATRRGSPPGRMALYFANWSTIAAHVFSRFGAPLPLDHLWSLSIEEQFYLVWPWLLLVLVHLVSNRRMMALITLAGAAASALLMSHLFHPGYDPTRVYEGTDTRAFGLLTGAALAMVRPI